MRQTLFSGGPADGDMRMLPDDVRVVFFPRLMIDRGRGFDTYEDAKFIHAYVRIDTSRFAYDGIRAIEQDLQSQFRLSR